MYSVLIADDELPILEGLQTIIDWHALGFSVCAAVQDGQAALAAISALQPDLVMMDIRMPGLDGLGAIEAARKAGYTGYFIILSGVSDFGSAQRAIRSRTSYYLTKPIDEDELADAVRAIAAELNARRQEESRTLQHARSSALFRLMTGVFNEQDRLAENGLAADAYQVLFYDSRSRSVSNPPPDLGALLNAGGCWARREDSIQIEGRYYQLLRGAALIARAKELLEGASSAAQNFWASAPDLFVAAGRPVQAPSDVVLSYCDTLQLEQRRFFSGPAQQLLCARDIPAPGARHPALDAAFSADYCRRLVDSIQAHNRSLLAQSFSSLEGDLAQCTESPTAIRMFLSELYTLLRQKLTGLYGEDFAGLSAAGPTVQAIEKQPALYQIVELLSRQCEVCMNALSASSSEDVVLEVQQYIAANCAQPLKLEDIAPLFGYNSAYLGKLFRRQAGCAFNTYVDQVRIGQAKALLRDDTVKVYEIAERIGYCDVDYFYRKFKKYVGLSPAEYRKSSRTD